MQWHKGVLRGPEKFTKSWHRDEERVGRLGEIKRGIQEHCTTETTSRPGRWRYREAENGAGVAAKDCRKDLAIRQHDMCRPWNRNVG